MRMLRSRLTVLFVVSLGCLFFLSLGRCSDDDKKPDGALCDAHAECASNLCTVVNLPEAGLTDGGAAPPKRCVSGQI
jgi:hypothetical protein